MARHVHEATPRSGDSLAPLPAYSPPPPVHELRGGRHLAAPRLRPLDRPGLLLDPDRPGLLRTPKEGPGLQRHVRSSSPCSSSSAARPTCSTCGPCGNRSIASTASSSCSRASSRPPPPPCCGVTCRGPSPSLPAAELALRGQELERLVAEQTAELTRGESGPAGERLRATTLAAVMRSVPAAISIIHGPECRDVIRNPEVDAIAPADRKGEEPPGRGPAGDAHDCPSASTRSGGRCRRNARRLTEAARDGVEVLDAESPSSSPGMVPSGTCWATRSPSGGPTGRCGGPWGRSSTSPRGGGPRKPSARARRGSARWPTRSRSWPGSPGPTATSSGTTDASTNIPARAGADGRLGLAGRARPGRTAQGARQVQGRRRQRRAVGGHLPAPEARRGDAAPPVAGTPGPRPGGPILVWFGTNTDIAERMELEAALTENDRRKDEFLAMLAHELRNPLAAIGTAVELLRQPDAAAEDAEWAKEVIERQVKHLARLIDDLLDVSRITRGKIELRKERVDARTVIGSAVETVRPLIEERKHELTISLAARPAAVRGRPDPARAGPRQPAHQRGQVHRAGAAHPADRPARGRRRRDQGRGQRHRHPAGEARPRSSSCSPRATARRPAPRAAWGSA